MRTITLDGQRLTLTNGETERAHKLASMRLAGPEHAQMDFNAWLSEARDVKSAIARRVAVGNALKLNTHQSVNIGSPELDAHPIAKANAASWPSVPLRGGKPTSSRELVKAATVRKGLTFTAADMGRAVFASDTWPPRPGAKLNSCADICSYITRVLFGRNLMLGRGPIRVNLENGHHLTITMEKDEV